MSGAIIPTYSQKAPEDKTVVQMDFVNAVGSSDTIVYRAVSAKPINRPIALDDLEIASAPNLSGTVVSFLISGGRNNEAYEIACTIETSAGELLTRRAHILVQSI